MTTATWPARTVECNLWAQPLYQFPSPYDYRIMSGGRGSSKTYEITQALVILGHQQPLRICVAREHKVSIAESALPELEARARSLGLLRPDCYRVTKSGLEHANGTHFFFIGLSVVSEEDIKGLALVDILWIEEGHQMSHSSWELADPTIRKDNAEIWVSFNPKYGYQQAWKLAQRKNDPAFWITKVTWRDNHFFTARNKRSRLRSQAEEPLRYRHIWEGELDHASDARKVIPHTLLEQCVEAWELRPTRGAWGTAGYDVADTGDAYNALAIRYGPELSHVERWRGSKEYTIVESVKHVAQSCVNRGVERVDYDGGGVGGGCRGIFRDWIRERTANLFANGAAFGGAVQGGDVIFEQRRPRSILNKQFFLNWHSQAGYRLRQRADNTARLLRGESVPLHECLFINPSIPELPDVLNQLAQAEWDDETGKYKIDKQPKKPGEPEPESPDAFDAVRLAFSYDCRRGLKQVS